MTGRLGMGSVHATAHSALAFCIALAATAPSAAQTVGGGLTSPDLPISAPLAEPQFRYEEESPLALPKVVPAKPAVDDTGGPTVTLRRIKIDGATLFTEKDFDPVLQGYLNRPVNAAGLEALRRAVTLLYVNAGYVNSGAVFPKQSLADGELVIRIVEGRLDDVLVEGTDRLNPALVRARLAGAADPALNTRHLENALKILIEEPYIDSAHARLQPGTSPGSARLAVEVRETPPYFLETVLSNEQSPSVGGNYWSGLLGIRNLIGNGDSTTVKVGLAKGLLEAEADVRVPLTLEGLTARVTIRTSDSAIVEDPLTPLDIESSSQRIQVGLDYPAFREPGRALWLGAHAFARRSETFLLDQPFSFHRGGRVGNKTVTSAFRFTQNWSDRRQDTVFAVSSAITVGVGLLGADSVGPEPDSQFLSWRGGVQYAQRFEAWDAQLIARGEVQISNGAVPASEQFALGGYGSVRGYRANQALGDSGVSGSIELRKTIYRGNTALFGDTALQMAGFVDMGRGWNSVGADTAALAGVGGGLRWLLGERLQAELYAAHALNDLDNASDDIQDSGIHFRIVARPF